MGSTSIFDYWDPTTAVQRILDGAAMDTMKVKVNGDFQEFEFSGPSQDLLDSASFHERAGRADAVSGGAGDRQISITRLCRGIWAGVDGASPSAVFDSDGGGVDAEEQYRAAGEGVRQRFCAVHCGGAADSDA